MVAIDLAVTNRIQNLQKRRKLRRTAATSRRSRASPHYSRGCIDRS